MFLMALNVVLVRVVITVAKDSGFFLSQDCFLGYFLHVLLCSPICCSTGQLSEGFFSELYFVMSFYYQKRCYLQLLQLRISEGSITL